MNLGRLFTAFVSTVAAAAGVGRSPQPHPSVEEPMSTDTTTTATAASHTISATVLASTLSSALTSLEQKFTGAKVDKLKASLKVALDDAVAASGDIAAQVFNAGIEAIPGVKFFAAPIELIADPIVSSTTENLAKQVEGAF